MDPATWLTSLKVAGDDNRSKQWLRADVSYQTLYDCHRLMYSSPMTGRPVIIASLAEVTAQIENSRLYVEKDLKERRHGVNVVYPTETSFEVINGDTIDVALRLKKERGLSPAVLNMASKKHPGGGYRTGAAAQEESLFRRTNYCESLEDPFRRVASKRWRYPLPEFGGVYSPNVKVFRRSERTGFAYMEAPVPLDFIAVPATYKPRLVRSPGGRSSLGEDDRDSMQRKARIVLDIALANGHDSLVLGAFGCGAYGNPPEDVAVLFRELFESESYRRRFKHVAFAIFDDANAYKPHNPEGNLVPFRRAFEKTH